MRTTPAATCPGLMESNSEGRHRVARSLPLQTEVRDAQRVLLDRSEATTVQYNVSIPDSTFLYTPRAGVQVATLSGGDGADVKRQLLGQQKGETQPAKSP